MVKYLGPGMVERIFKFSGMKKAAVYCSQCGAKSGFRLLEKDGAHRYYCRKCGVENDEYRLSISGTEVNGQESQ